MTPACDDCGATDFECSACGHDLDIDNLIGDDASYRAGLAARSDDAYLVGVSYGREDARRDLAEQLREVLAGTRDQVAEMIGCAEQIHGEDYTVWHGADAALVAIAHALGLAPHVDTEARVTFVEGGPTVVQMVPSSW